MTDSLERAHRSWAEIRARQQLDEQADAEHRAEQLARWHADDRAAELDGHDTVDEDTTECEARGTGRSADQ